MSVQVTSNPKQAELDALDVQSWPIWEKEASRFPWRYEMEEICYILEGEVTVVTAAGEAFEIKAGDLVVFEKDLECIWDIKSDIKKHYMFR